ncbi:MAG TPA: sigma factor [Candidatus Dormibacteraeota bacterium]|nr:sigma factor [Candidatus Dormibacteraeota bacterium]
MSHRDGSERERLLRAAAEGDRSARETLVQTHVDWVREALEARRGAALDVGDLFQEGTVGLLQAIDRFNESGSDDFEAFARRSISEHMDGALQAEDAAATEARVVVQAAEDFERVEIQLHRVHGRPPTDEEIARQLEWTVARTLEVRQIVERARTHHDEEILPFLDSDEVSMDDIERMVDERSQDGE